MVECGLRRADRVAWTPGRFRVKSIIVAYQHGDVMYSAPRQRQRLEAVGLSIHSDMKESTIKLVITILLWALRSPRHRVFVTRTGGKDLPRSVVAARSHAKW